MATTNPGKITGSASTVIRTALFSALPDSATIDDDNFPPDDATVCDGWQTVLVSAAFTGGTAPTATLVFLLRMGDTWVRTTAAPVSLAEGQVVAVQVYGRKLFVRIAGVTGGATSVALSCGGAVAMRPDVASRD
mgnify:CR=1 FL=1